MVCTHSLLPLSRISSLILNIFTRSYPSWNNRIAQFSQSICDTRQDNITGRWWFSLFLLDLNSCDILLPWYFNETQHLAKKRTKLWRISASLLWRARWEWTSCGLSGMTRLWSAVLNDDKAQRQGDHFSFLPPQHHIYLRLTIKQGCVHFPRHHKLRSVAFCNLALY